MAKVMTSVVLALLTATSHQRDNHELLPTSFEWWWGCWWGWGWNCGCVVYPKDYVCCKEVTKGCCQRRHLHEVPATACSKTKKPFYWADPCDCAKFYRCYNRQVKHISCPLRGAWDQTSLECVRVHSLKPRVCASRPFTPPRLPAIYGEYNITAFNGTSGERFLSFVDFAPYGSVHDIKTYLAGKRADFSFESAYDKRFWYFIKCINGICANYLADKTWWSFRINGVLSSQGASHVVGKHKDVFTFELVKERTYTGD